MSTDLFRWHQYQGDGTNDCAAYCVAILANAWFRGLHLQGSAVAQDMERPIWARAPVPHPTLHKIPHWAALPWGISGYLRRLGIPARLRWLGSTEDLLRNILNHRLTIVLVGEPFRHVRFTFRGWAHTKLLYGYEPLGPHPEKGFYFVDPGFPKEWSNPRHPAGVFRQDEGEFRKQWGRMLRLYIETESSPAG